MGTKLPFYGYIDMTAHLNDGGNIINGHVEKMGSVDQFMAYMSRDDVKRLRYNVICDNFDPEVNEWAREVRRETNCESRPDLLALVEMINKNGSIIVPTIGDLTKSKSKTTVDLIERILADQIPLIAIHHDEFPLDIFLDDPRADGRVFGVMVDNAMHINGSLRRLVQNRSKIKM